ncbi:helix-turn-helix domain-containing protein [Aliiglaciecola litoralis]
MRINTPKDLGAIIKDSRKSHNWTQTDLAERIGVFQKDISNWETKPEKITIDMLIKVCAALDLDFNIDKLSHNKKVSAITGKPRLGF